MIEICARHVKAVCTYLIPVHILDVIFQTKLLLCQVHHELVGLLFEFPGLLLCLDLLQVDDVSLCDGLLLQLQVLLNQRFHTQLRLLLRVQLSRQVLTLRLL